MAINWKEMARHFRYGRTLARQQEGRLKRRLWDERARRLVFVNTMTELLPRLAIYGEWCRACDARWSEGHRENCNYIAALNALNEAREERLMTRLSDSEIDAEIEARQHERHDARLADPRWQMVEDEWTPILGGGVWKETRMSHERDMNALAEYGRQAFAPEWEHTTRQFRVGRWRDYYGQECSIQESSIATEYAIWLGVDPCRMHLTLDQIRGLVHVLSDFLADRDLSAQFPDERYDPEADEDADD